MIEVKQAIETAKAYAADLLGTSDLLLEEVHSSEDTFEITLSFPQRGVPRVNPLLTGLPEPREYKTVRVRKDSGEVVGMFIHQIA